MTGRVVAEGGEMKLRPYQQKWLKRIFAAEGRVLVVGPTGAGKTVVAAALIRKARKEGKRVLFLAHRRDLVNQCVTRLHSVGIARVGVIMAGCPADPDADVQVASIQTYARRQAQQFDIVFIDEAHHATAKSYRKVIEDNQDAQLYGLTATPVRLDGKPLNDLFDSVAQSEFAPALIEQGALAKVRVWSHPAPDLSGVKRVGGDYDRNELGRRMKHKSIGDVVEHWELRAERRPAVCFAVNVEHAKRVVAEFRKRGYSAGLVVADTPIDERARVISGLSTGETNVVVTVEVLTEGWDCPDAACCIMLRPTMSEALCRQMMGRALRPTSKWPHSVILDHVGNTIRRVRILPDEARDWSDALDPKKPREPGGEARTKECPDCGNSAWFGARTCGFCEHVFWVHEPPAEVSGWLEELTRDVRQEVVEWMRAGNGTSYDAERLFGVNNTTVGKWCKAAGIKLVNPLYKSDELRKKVVAWVRAGNGSAYEAAKLFGMDHSTVCDWCAVANIKLVNPLYKSDEFRKKVVDWIRAGNGNATEAGKLFGVSSSAITNWCQDAGIKLVNRRYKSDELRRDVLNWIRAGNGSMKKAARLFGVSRDTIRKWCKAAGFTCSGKNPNVTWTAPENWSNAA